MKALWLPGTNHASISTEVKSNEYVKKDEGIDKHGKSLEEKAFKKNMGMERRV